MVTTSFTLRKTSSGFGSYLQKNGNTDSALRSDQYTAVGTAVSDDNTFSANIINADKITLSWELSFSLSASAGSTPVPTELRVVASTTGEPLTVKDGTQVYSSTRTDITSFDDIVRVSPGRWVYYSLFLKYATSTGTSYFERLATLYIQVPITYLSVDNLWARVPEYYRTMDAEQEGNPLYNFLELFGWEIDRTRTLIETIPLAMDPDLAVTPALAALATQMGLETTIDVVGTTKVRNLLQNIGYIRRRKGTLESISYYLSALTGCEISYVTTGSGASASYNFKVHAERVNFSSDPTFYQAALAPTTGTGATYRTSLTKSTTWGVYSYGATTTTGASVTTNGSTLTIKNVGTGTINALVYQRLPFPYYPPANLYTNFNSTQTSGASFINFHISTAAKMAQWESTIASGSVPSPLFYDTWNTTSLKLPVDAFYPNEKRYGINYNSTSTTTVSSIPILQYTLGAGDSVTLTNWLVEPFDVNSYFDGYTREGGLLPTASGAAGTGTSDYRWASTASNSFSYYMLDYQKVVSVVNKIIINYIAPVTIKDQIAIEWNYYYGK